MITQIVTACVVCGLCAVSGLLATTPVAAADPSPPVTSYPLPTPGAQPQQITATPDGAVWFTESAADQIGEVAPDGTVHEFTVPSPASAPQGIAAAPDGSVWFTESAADKIGRLTPDGAVTEYAVPTAASEPHSITIGPDGDPWFTESAGNAIGTVRDGTVVEYPVPTPDRDPDAITTAADGTIWFTELSVPSLGSITTAGAIAQTTLPTSGTSAVATDAVGNVWLIQPTFRGIAPAVIQLPPSGPFPLAETFLPAQSNPSAITLGPDGAAWLALAGTDQIARITYTGFGGINHQYDIGVSPQDIVAGADDTLWFTDPADNTVGRIDLDPPSITSPSTLSLVAGRAGSVAVTTAGFPAPSVNAVGGLPGGLTFTANAVGTATISGTAPAADAGHTYPLTVTATSGLGPAASQSLSLKITRPASRRPGRVTVGRPRTKRATVRVTVTCHGSTGQRCSVTATLTGHRRGVSARIRRTVTLRAGWHRTLRFHPARLARSGHRTRVTVTVVQHRTGSAATVRRRSRVTLR